MRIKNRHVLLLVDNCQPHQNMPNLTNVKLVFFPPNLTSKLQPMDQGIINETKKRSRSIIVRKLMDQLDKKESPTINILQAIFNISVAWKEITSTVIKNCFRHAKLFRTEPADVVSVEIDKAPADADESFGLLNSDYVTPEDYYHVDDDVRLSRD